MNAPPDPLLFGVLGDDAYESVMAALPAAVLECTDDRGGRLLPTALATTIGAQVGERTELADLIEPAHLATALTLLAQGEPTPVPTATRLRLATVEGPIEVLATSRRLSAEGDGARPLLAFIKAPDASADEDELRHRHETLIEAERVATLGSWDWDIASDEVTWSDELYRIYGYQPGAFAVSLVDVFEHTVPDDRDYTRAVVEHGLASQLPFTYAHRIERPDGEVRTLHSRGRVTEVDDAGHPLHMVGVCQDVTAQQELQELGRQYRELYERERRVAGRLREVDELKDALVAAVSHDLRTPLTVIVGSATTLRDHGDDIDEPTRELLVDNVTSNAARLRAMLSDLLDLDRLRRGTIEPQLRRTRMRNLVARVLREGGYDDGRVVLEATGPDVVADLDAPKVERIVENLVRNSLRFAPDGTQVHVRIGCDDTNAVLTVEDAGPGVPEDARRRIFEPFERGSSAGDPDSGSGSGLGLAIVNQFARLHHGRAWVDDRAGGGAAFHVRVPLRGHERLL